MIPRQCTIGKCAHLQRRDASSASNHRLFDNYDNYMEAECVVTQFGHAPSDTNAMIATFFLAVPS